MFFLPFHQVQDSKPKVEELRVGAGNESKVGEIVKVHIIVIGSDGKVRADTIKRGLPLTFEIKPVTADNWRSMVTGMKVGGVRRSVFPESKDGKNSLSITIKFIAFQNKEETPKIAK